MIQNPLYIEFELNQDSLRKVDRVGMGGFAIASSSLLSKVNEESMYRLKERPFSPPFNCLKEVIKVEKT
jgi:hypothetical protein